MRKALIIHQYLPPEAPPDELDVLDQAEAIGKSMEKLGYQPHILPVSMNLELFLQDLTRLSPEVVVNLVETLGNQGRLIHLVPAVLEAAGIRFTGCGERAMYLTTGKVSAKREMAHSGIPTADFFTAGQVHDIPSGKKYVLKPVWEDASVGITDEQVVTVERAPEALRKAMETGIREWFFEEYIDGREFNVTMLETRKGWNIFSPAEILFVDYPEEKPKILGYESKWADDSFEYHNTPRTFAIREEDRQLIESIRDISRKCIGAFQLKGYARVDFRVDKNNRPFVLEVNANPCLSPDAGFYAACAHAGMDYTEMVRHIIESALS